MTGRPLWERDGRTWPNRAASRFVRAGGMRWHVQEMGDGPVLLLIHGTGAATHSWRALAPLLATSFRVIAPDLPGHGFTDTPARSSGFTLPGVAAGIAALLREIGATPAVAVGHSAGAAILIRMCLDGMIAPDVIVSLNGALVPFPGMSNTLFGRIARVLASTPATAQLFTMFAGGKQSAERMLLASGSKIDAEGVRLYSMLVGKPSHVGGALSLMANWDLHPLARDMPKLATRLVLVAGTKDGMVPPSQAARVKAAVPMAEVVTLPGLGHLAHEERPDEVAALIRRVTSGIGAR